MAIQKAEVFVLKTQPYRSSSLILTFYSKPFGKIRGIAKGVRREGEIRGAVYELFTHLEIVFYEKTRSDLHLISEASIIESHDPLRARLETIAYASYFSELVDLVTEAHDPHEKIFELLDFAFHFLPSLATEHLSRLFEIKLLHEVGWLPYLKACLGCRETKFEAGFFSIQQGALFCSRCALQWPDARPLDADVLAVMRYYIAHDLESSMKFRTTPQTDVQLAKLMEQFLLFRLNRTLKSRQFIHEIKPALASS
ncbi:MAG: DNA repair protein RecO [Candidatus Omnitrophica bacterium]|nr:DNA repair protein RecO [Candidatus Omnitrophota bacterium]